MGWSWHVPRPWFQCWCVGWRVFLCWLHGKVKRCVRFCDVVGYVLCSVLGLFICLWFLLWLSLVAFLMFPVGIAWKVKWRVKLQVFATLILGARGRSNIFQHQKASARCLAVSILFQGGPGNGPTKRIQNRFRLEGAPAVFTYLRKPSCGARNMNVVGPPKTVHIRGHNGRVLVVLHFWDWAWLLVWSLLILQHGFDRLEIGQRGQFEGAF